VPLAATLGGAKVAFVIVTVGGAVSVGQEQLYDQLTGYATCAPSGLSDDEVIALLDAAGVSGFDPTASLEALTQPTLWVYGGRDLSHPTTLAVRNLQEIQARIPKPWTIRVFPTANHELIDNGGICQAEGPLVDVGPAIAEFLASLP